MTPKQLILLTSQRSGICTATVEHVLPICFDIIRETVITGMYCGSVRIDGFGTFYAQNRRSDVADPDNPGQRIQGYRLKPRFMPTSGFRRETEIEQVNPQTHAFQYTDKSQIARRPHSRKYRFRSPETREHMIAVGHAQKHRIHDVNQLRLQQYRDPKTIRQCVTRQEIREQARQQRQQETQPQDPGTQ